MSWTSILFWLFVAYAAIVILWRLVVSILMMIASYAEEGLGAAIGTAIIAFLISVWDLLKFVISIAVIVLIIALITRAC